MFYSHSFFLFFIENSFIKFFFTVEGEPVVSAMYKVGDDLRQDMLTLQMVRIMDKLWLKNGLDLKMVTFACVPTGSRRGFIELVPGAETLRRIQVCRRTFFVDLFCGSYHGRMFVNFHRPYFSFAIYETGGTRFNGFFQGPAYC